MLVKLSPVCPPSSPSASLETGSGNTRSLCQSPVNTIDIDWINCGKALATNDEAEKLLTYLSAALKDEYTIAEGRGHRFGAGVFLANKADFVRGMDVYWTSPEDSVSGDPRVQVTINGASLHSLSMEEKVDLIGTLHRQGYRFTRLDANHDDYSRKLPFDEMLEAARVGNFRGAKSKRYLDSFPGQTLTFGTRESDLMTNFYDKSIESQGKIDAWRTEVSIGAHRLKSVIPDLLKAWELNHEDDGFYTRYFISLVFGHVDFIDRSTGEKHLDRLSRLQFWGDYLDFVNAVPIRYPAAKEVPTIEKKLRHVYRNVSTSLVMLQEALGADKYRQFLENCYRYGEDRMTNRHEAIINQYHNSTTHELSISSDVMGIPSTPPPSSLSPPLPPSPSPYTQRTQRGGARGFRSSPPVLLDFTPDRLRAVSEKLLIKNWEYVIPRLNSMDIGLKYQHIPDFCLKLLTRDEKDNLFALAYWDEHCQFSLYFAYEAYKNNDLFMCTVQYLNGHVDIEKDYLNLLG